MRLDPVWITVGLFSLAAGLYLLAGALALAAMPWRGK